MWVLLLLLCVRVMFMFVCVWLFVCCACVLVFVRMQELSAYVHVLRVLMLALFHVALEIDGGALVASVLIKCCNVGRVYFSLLLPLFCAGEIYWLSHYWTIWTATELSKFVLHITSRVVC